MMRQLRRLARALVTVLLPGCGPERVDGAGATDSGASSTATSAASTLGATVTGGPEHTEDTGSFVTSAASTSAATSTGPEPTGSTGVGALPCIDDAHEPNDLPESPTFAPWEIFEQNRVILSLDAFLCAGESDWYRIDVAALEFPFNVLYVDGIVEGSSWCGCDYNDWLDEAPEHTLAIDVHDAETLELLVGEVSTEGRVNVEGGGHEFEKDLLIHVHADPLVATYPYTLSLEIRGYDGEDECEC